MFKRNSGRPQIEYMPKKASTAFEFGCLVYADGSGAVQPGDTTSGDHFGVAMKEVTSADADYAQNSMLMIDVATPGDTFEVDVPSGLLATTDVGNTCDLTADGAGIDPDTATKDQVTIVGYISASKAVVKINSMAAHLRVATT